MPRHRRGYAIYVAHTLFGKHESYITNSISLSMRIYATYSYQLFIFRQVTNKRYMDSYLIINKSIFEQTMFKIIFPFS